MFNRVVYPNGPVLCDMIMHALKSKEYEMRTDKK